MKAVTRDREDARGDVERDELAMDPETLERVADEANVKKDVSELVGLSATESPSESARGLNACVDEEERTISDAFRIASVS
jgi:hypothetical protein